MIVSLVFAVVGAGGVPAALRRRVVFGAELSSLAAAERAAGDFAVRIVFDASLLLADFGSAFFGAAAGLALFAAGFAEALGAAAFLAGAAFTAVDLIALLVELSALAASDRAAGDFAVRIVLAASALLAGLAAAFAGAFAPVVADVFALAFATVFAGALAAFGSAFDAVAGAAFFAAFGVAVFLAGAFGAAGLAAVLVAARTAIACTREASLLSSLLIVSVP